MNKKTETMTHTYQLKKTIAIITIVLCTLIIQNVTGIINITPTPTPNPYGLDSSGYYIADPNKETGLDDPNMLFRKYYSDEYDEDRDLLNPTDTKPYVNNSCTITVNKPIFTSAEELIIDGTSKLPPNTLISFTIRNEPEPAPYEAQLFSAPTLPKQKQTTSTQSIIKVKIPALNIHLADTARQFSNNTPINFTISFGNQTIPFTIIYDTNHPMIIETNKLFLGFPSGCKGCCYPYSCKPDVDWNSNPPVGSDRINTWRWTNTNTTKYTWISSNYYNLYPNIPATRPYPTYPKPPQSW
jgi:hypothetical protein